MKSLDPASLARPLILTHLIGCQVASEDSCKTFSQKIHFVADITTTNNEICRQEHLVLSLSVMVSSPCRKDLSARESLTCRGSERRPIKNLRARASNVCRNGTCITRPWSAVVSFTHLTFRHKPHMATSFPMVPAGAAGQRE